MKIKTSADFFNTIGQSILQIKQIQSASGKEWRQKLSMVWSGFRHAQAELTNRSPELYQYASGESIESLAQTIKENAEMRFALDATPYSYAHWTIQDKTVYAPIFVTWDKPILVSYEKTNQPKGIATLNQLLFNALIQLPTNSIVLHIVDIDISGATAILTSNIQKQIYNDTVLTSVSTIQQDISNLKKLIVERINTHNDYVAYCNSRQKIDEPYHIVVFSSLSPEVLKYNKSDIDILLNRGIQAGVYSVFINDTKSVFPFSATAMNIIKPFVEKYDEDAINTPAPIIENNELAKLCYRSINNAPETPKINLKADGFIETTSSISFPIGKDADNNMVNFTFNISDHPHAFILGQSGTGKSVFLHSILYKIIANYSPEDVQLYLFDLKLGGVEFVLYKNVPHVESLLIDSNDAEITLNILQDLYKKMQERGKKLRETGNIEEYNQRHPNEKMPQIIVAMDECHVLFSSSNSRKLQNQINSVVIKIATEGRSQGVHLLLATQTLANTEIPIEILNNITDAYLFKCSSSDSNRMAEGSDRFTRNLAVGQVYYKHVDYSITFTTEYTPREEQKVKIEEAVKKCAQCTANRRFIYNGSQVAILDKSVIDPMLTSGLAGYIGRSIQLDQSVVSIQLKKDYSENVMLFGIDDNGQTTQVTFNLFASMIFQQKQQSDVSCNFYVFDCINDESLPYYEQLENLETEGLCRIVRGKERGKLLYNLANSIKNGNATPSVLLILGQEKFRELRNDFDIEESNEEPSPNTNDIFAMAGSFKSSKSNPFSSYSKVVPYILDNGSEQRVHIILQVDKPSKLLFEEYQSPKYIYKKFKHIVMLHCDDTIAKNLVLDDIHIDELSTDTDRLRAVYYNEDSDKYQTFTPFKLVNTNNLK